MKEDSKEKPKKIEELKHFPFKNFQEFRKAYLEGVVDIGVDRGIAREWASNGIYSSWWLRVKTHFWIILPYVTFLIFIFYIFISQSWWLIFSLPVVVVSFFIFFPGTEHFLGPIKSGLVFFTIGFLIWGIINNITWLIILASFLALIWYSLRALHLGATKNLIYAASEHEDLLCLLWNIQAMNVRFYNGNSYWPRWKDENGRTTHYDTGNVYESDRMKQMSKFVEQDKENKL